jgi:hypothetical protein
MFDDLYVIEAGGGASVTVRSADGRAIVLEMRIPPGGAAHWFSALAAFDMRLEVLSGALLIGDAIVNRGERMVVAQGCDVALAADHADEVHFVCELHPTVDPGALVAALRTLGRPHAFQRELN